MSIEDLAEHLGKPGRLQLILYIMLCCNVSFISWNHLAMTFFGAQTKHHCAVKNKTMIHSLVPGMANGENDGCNLFSSDNATEKRSCENGWTYYLPGNEKTIISQWDLVCNNAFKVHLATTIYFCGVLLGGLIFGPLSDKFGRRRLFLFTMYSPAALGLAIFLLKDSYLAFVVLRFILGFILQGLHGVSYVSIIELFHKRYRSIVGTACAIFWSLGVMSFALISFVIQDWRYIQLFITVITVTQISLIWLLPESFRWSLAQHRFEGAENAVRKIVNFNNIPYPSEAFEKAVQKSTEVSADGKKYTIIDMFRYKVLRFRSIILAWIWFSASIGYFGITHNISTMAGNKYVNFFFGGLLEMSAYITTVFVSRRYGRRKPLCVYLMVSSIMGITAGALRDKSDDIPRHTTTVLAIIGMVGCAGAFSVLDVFTSELYPTVIRNVGYGACASWARVGGIIAPQILLVGENTKRSVPFIVFGCCAFVASLISLLLPETLNKSLADTIEEEIELQKDKLPMEEMHITDGPTQLSTNM